MPFSQANDQTRDQAFAPTTVECAFSMTSADVRARLTHALRLDLIGPQPEEPQVAETLPIPPSRWSSVCC